MKIRYYLRGLGLGILVTAVFFMLGGNSKQTMSDEMIKERAKELGMIENTVLADIGTTAESVEETISGAEVETEVVSEEESAPETIVEEVTETEVTEEVTVEEATQTESVEESVEESTVEESEEVTSQIEETEEAEKPSDGQIFSIIVNKGEGSDTVSQRLYEAGLVDDPYAYDKYLMQNGYDRRIGAGEHLIPSGSSWQEIAQILCS